MAIAGFLVGMCLALRASGLWLRYATLQNLIPSFPWIAPPRPPPWRNARKGRDQILPSGNLAHSCRRPARPASPPAGATPWRTGTPPRVSGRWGSPSWRAARGSTMTSRSRSAAAGQRAGRMHAKVRARKPISPYYCHLGSSLVTKFVNENIYLI